MATDSSIPIAAGFIPQLLTGVLGETGVALLTKWLWVGLAVLMAGLLIWASARIAGFAALLIAVMVAAVLVLTRLDKVWWWLWLVPAALTVMAALTWRAKVEHRWVARSFFGVLLLVTLLAGVSVNRFAAGKLAAIDLGPLPRGVPVSLIMNMNPEAPRLNLVRAIAGLTRGLALAKREADSEARRVVFEREAAHALLAVSKCPDFVLDRGHWFGEQLTSDEKAQLKAFLKTL